MKQLLLALLLALASTGCQKTGEKHPCYDPALVHNGACTTDCPGFVGCDGVTYCNRCEAARVGIGPK